MKILGIESSCDETAAAVVEDGNQILSSVVASQNEIHAKHGGIVPELASRRHVSNVLRVIEDALAQAKITMKEVDAIAVTKGPGLIGSLLVGLSVAKAIAYSQKKPFLGVHHIEGHVEAALLDQKRQPHFPLVGLVVSGGHTCIYRLPKRGTYEILGETRDDAAGEAFDKVSNLLGLGFPGGPAIQRAAETGNPSAIQFPRANLKPTLDFSFSGIKTAVAVGIKKNGQPQGKALSDMAASFQEAVVDMLIDTFFEAVEREDNIQDVLICGGVAKNQVFRHRLEKEAGKRDLTLWMAPLDLCTDNAAMIAAAGYARLARGECDDLTLNAQATMPIG